MVFTDGRQARKEDVCRTIYHYRLSTTEFDLVVIGSSCMHEKLLVVARWFMKYGCALTCHCLKYKAALTVVPTNHQGVHLGEIIVGNFYIT